MKNVVRYFFSTYRLSNNSEFDLFHFLLLICKPFKRLSFFFDLYFLKRYSKFIGLNSLKRNSVVLIMVADCLFRRAVR